MNNTNTANNRYDELPALTQVVFDQLINAVASRPGAGEEIRHALVVLLSDIRDWA